MSNNREIIKKAFEIYNQHKEYIEYGLLEKAHMKYTELLDLVNQIPDELLPIFDDLIKVRPNDFMITFDIVFTHVYRESEEFDFPHDINSHENLTKLIDMAHSMAEYRLSLTEESLSKKDIESYDHDKPTVQNLKLWKRKDNYVWEEMIGVIYG